MATLAEYRTKSMLLGEGWTYDPTDHTMARQVGDMWYCHDPDTMAPIAIVSREDVEWLDNIGDGEMLPENVAKLFERRQAVIREQIGPDDFAT